MTDIERVELAVRRTAGKMTMHINGPTQGAIRAWLLDLASELAIAQKHKDEAK